jgi:hypothetical protein
MHYKGQDVGGMTTPEAANLRGGGWRLVGLLMLVLAIVVAMNRPWTSDVPRGEPAASANSDEMTGPTVTLAMSLPGRQVSPLILPIDEGMTLLEVMRLASQRDPAWVFALQGDGVDAFVVKLAGKANGEPEGHYWTYDLNGEPGQVGIGACQLAEGDDVLWKFAPYE